MAMMAMTTSSSTSVKADRRDGWDMAIAFVRKSGFGFATDNETLYQNDFGILAEPLRTSKGALRDSCVQRLLYL